MSGSEPGFKTLVLDSLDILTYELFIEGSVVQSLRVHGTLEKWNPRKKCHNQGTPPLPKSENFIKFDQ